MTGPWCSQFLALLKPSGSVNIAGVRESLLSMCFLSLVFALNAANAVVLVRQWLQAVILLEVVHLELYV